MHVCYPYSYVCNLLVEHHHVGQYNCQLYLVVHAQLDLQYYNYGMAFWDMFVTPAFIVMHVY